MSLRIKQRKFFLTSISVNVINSTIFSRFLLLVLCGTLVLAWSGVALAETSNSGAITKEQNAEPARPVLDATWYGPKQVPKTHKTPTAVILASKDFPVTSKDYWIPTLWQLNFSTLVLKCPGDKWNDISVSQIHAQLARCPKSVPAELGRVLLVCDQASAGLAMRFMDGYPQEMIGIVLISVTPVELTSKGLSLWSPRTECWSVPIWAVVGTRPKDAAKVLEMWRKLESFVPAEASLTIDTRIGRGNGYLLPDESIITWLQSAGAGQKPKPGPDRQAQAEQTRFALTADSIADAMQQKQSIAQPGPVAFKNEGPFSISVVMPKGWLRDSAAERRYNPLGLAADKEGLPLGGQKNPYSEIYITPKKQGLLFARVYAMEWTKTSAELLADYHKKLARKGYSQIPLKSWQQNDWTYEIYSIMQPWQGKWSRWLILAAARGGSPSNPAGAMAIVMDASENPSAATMAGALQRICESVKTSKKTEP